jgi:amino acid adenylation domain-containing protein
MPVTFRDERGGTPVTSPGQHDHSGVHPLSFSQTRLWFLHQLIPGNTAHNVSCAYRLRGPLDLAAFSAAFSDLVLRHESLRSRTVMSAGSPGQVVDAHVPVTMRAEDVQGTGEQDRMRAAVEVAEQVAAEPFDLSTAPLFRHRMLRLADEDHVLVLTLHHLLCDGWSLEVLWRDLDVLYSARIREESPALPELPLRYVDHVRRERIRQSDEELLGDELSYWRGQLERLAPLRLPTDRARPADRNPGGARIPFALTAELTEGVRWLSRRLRVTPFMTLLAAFQLLLARWSGQDDVAVGSPVAGRGTPDVEHLVGLFANTLVLRTDLSHDPTFRELAARVREVVLDALDHQELSFDKLVAELHPARDLSFHPFFQVMISVQDRPVVPRLAGLLVERVPVQRNSAQFDLSLSLFTADTGMYGEFEYATDLFDAGTVRRMGEQFTALLEAVIDDPERPAAVVPLAGSEPHSATCMIRPPRPESSLVELVESQASRTPDAVAVVYGEEEIRYAELQARADLLAAELRERGVRAEVPVGLYLERSPEMVIGVLAILKSGGACLPLSTRLPVDRIRTVMRLAGAEIMLTDQMISVSAGTVPSVVELGRKPVAPDNLAFVLTTSGSSGTPKLVALTHRNLAGFVTTALHSYKLSAGDRLLGFWPHGSDGSIEEIFLTLCGGATLVLAEHVVETAPRFARLCERLGITAVMLPTAYWHHLADGLREQDMSLPETVRLVTFGGEPALPERLTDWLRHTGDHVRLVNEYGPSETTIFTTKHELPRLDRPRHVPIGVPIAGATAHVLDPALRPVPSGVVGELYLGGVCVARGYLGRPGETAGRFVADPLAREPGARLFRTGDLARRGADGSLEFIGRADQQVKVRGFRIEPEEVERTLVQDPAIAQAAVTADEDLVGYLVTDADLDSIKVRLADRLPDYMIPAHLIAMDRLPMTATGKVDRQALPPPPRNAVPRRTIDSVAARTPVEEHLAQLWRQILRIDRVGVLDTFHDLGGHSLQAAQLASGVAATFGVEVPVALILRRSTIAGLAEEIEMRLEDEVAHPVASAAPGWTASRTYGAAGVTFRRFVTRPLAALLDAEELPPVDAASISCIPDHALRVRGLTAEQYIEDWCQGVAIISGVKDTPVGRIAHVVIPYLESRVYREPGDLVQTVIPGLALARRAGAKVVSLINLLSSATAHGVTLRDAIGTRTDLPRVTTGHAMTTAAVVLNMREVLAAAGRLMSGEELAVLGLGSIGHSVLRLLLSRGERPRRILLCDLYSRRDHLEEIRDEVRGRLGFDGRVDVLTSTGDSVPDQLYEASAIVAATNVPSVLDVDRLPSGCVVVDDSVPHCFDPARSASRLAARSDVLCAEGGELCSPTPMSELRYLPRWATTGRTWETIDRWYERDPQRFGGCVLAAALAARFDEVPVTVGVPDLAASEQALGLLPRLGFQAVRPQCDDTVFTEDQLARFRQRFGNGA